MANIFNQREAKEVRRDLRKVQTRAEELLWNVLRGSRLGLRFRRQFGVGPYIVDFYAPRARLVIEVDGSVHDLDRVHALDVHRQRDIEALGLKFLRFTNHEITGNMEAVLLQIRLALNQNPLLTKERVG
jgi:very-short-patch-repair endonuclease